MYFIVVDLTVSFVSGTCYMQSSSDNLTTLFYEGVIHSNICLSLQIRFFGSDLSAITELIDIDLLPEELGGSGAVFSSRYTASLLNSVSSNPEVPEDSTGVV